MIEILFIIACVWMIVTCYLFGWTFLRRWRNHLLGIELLVVGTSGMNFLLWSLLGGDEHSPMYTLAYFLDAFSRSFGITLVLILGLMAVTHRYRPSRAVEIGAFALAAVGGLVLHRYHVDGMLFVVPATFYVVVNFATSIFLLYFAMRLWRIGARSLAVWTVAITLAAVGIALTYDFFPFPFDDANRTYFYTAALATWGGQALIYYFGYRALAARNQAADVARDHTSTTTTMEGR